MSRSRNYDDDVYSSDLEYSSIESLDVEDNDSSSELGSAIPGTQGRGLQNIEEIWPLRLLHVKTMTSIPRHIRSHNISYGDTHQPKYNILSYTWGRFQENNGEAIQVTLPDGGRLPWYIPRVSREKAFGAHQFEMVLRRVAGDLDFVWVDVACINQSPDAPEYTAEIGRQAAIFNRAKRAYVWLHQTTGEDIRVGLELMTEILNEALRTKTAVNGQPRYSGNQHQRRADCAAVNRILEDPWFSSLWTLQEAYIKKEAIILSREGRPVEFDGENLTIASLSALCTKVYVWIWQPTKTLIDSAGLNKLQSQNPTVLLSISTRRTTLRPDDRIYGIMQVFGLRLGKAADGADPNRHFSLHQLEAQLSRDITTATPTVGQMFLHRDQPARGRGWQHNIGVVTPDRHFPARHGATRPGLDLTLFLPGEFNFATEIARHCRITFLHEDTPTFTGRMWGLADLLERWIEEEGEPERTPGLVYPDEGKTPEMNTFRRSLWLDHCSGVQGEGIPPVQGNFPSCGRPVAIAASIERITPGRIKILVLGQIKDGVSGGEAYTGLLVEVRGAGDWYRRVGFCTWQGRPDGVTVEEVRCCFG